MTKTSPCSPPPPVKDLATMDRSALLSCWRNIFGALPPRRLSSAFLRRFLAFEIQARDCGGLPGSFDARLRAGADAPARKKAPALKPGARILREWNGVTHTVEVTAEGYLWNGDRYRSLSAIARAITGARWSGPRFFGVKEMAR